MLLFKKGQKTRTDHLCGCSVRVCVCACACTSMYNMCVCVCVSCWGCEWEGGVSLRDVSLWCFPNQWVGTIADEDVMPSSDFLSRCFIFARICINFHLVHSCPFSRRVCFVFLYLFCRVGAHGLFFLFFFYEWDVLFTLWWSYFCLCWWCIRTVWPHTSSSVSLLLPLIG